MKRLFVVVASVAVLVGAGASGAFAGEVIGPPGTPGVPGSGSGEPTGARTNSNSICSYSGLNDMKNGPVDQITQTPGNQGPPGAPGQGTCAGGSNPNRDK
jgi:hypothetical protein